MAAAAAPGSCASPGDPDASGRGEAGFSLIEMLVVLAIIGLASAMVMLNARPSTQSLGAETDLLAARILAARDLALTRNRPVRVEIAAEGYEARIGGRMGWTPPERAPEPVAWQDGTTVSTSTRELPLLVQFDSIGSTEPASITLSRDGRSATVSVDGAGNVRREDGRGR